VLEDAKRAIYHLRDIDPVPKMLRKNYFMKSIDPEAKLVRIVPELRSKISLRRLNLMDSDFQFREPMDIIFCRNVFIYFDKETQDDLVLRLCQTLRPNGYLFMGNSEMLKCQDLPIVSVAPSIYRKRAM
jgi:chemotaxis protein methyltransferase CheR